MLQITESAKAELKRLLDCSVDWPGARLRLLERDQGSLGLGVDIEAGDDQMVEYQGTGVLVVEPDLASRLNKILLDIDPSPDGAVLVISEQNTPATETTDENDIHE